MAIVRVDISSSNISELSIEQCTIVYVVEQGSLVQSEQLLTMLSMDGWSWIGQKVRSFTPEFKVSKRHCFAGSHD